MILSLNTSNLSWDVAAAEANSRDFEFVVGSSVFLVGTRPMLVAAGSSVFLVVASPGLMLPCHSRRSGDISA